MNGHGPTGPWRTTIAAHRGGAGLWPENSLTAFRKLTGLAVDYVECDLHLSRDGRLVVHHDPALGRTTTGTGPIAAQPWDALVRSTVMGTGGERLPLLEDVIGIFKPTTIGLRLEIKVGTTGTPYAGLEQAMAGLLARHGMLERTLVTSFRVESLAAFREAGRPAGLIWLIRPSGLFPGRALEPLLRSAHDHEIGEIGLHRKVIDQRQILIAKDAGIRLGAFAVKRERAIRRVLALGVTTFTTDRPDLAVRIREEMRRDGSIPEGVES